MLTQGMPLRLAGPPPKAAGNKSRSAILSNGAYPKPLGHWPMCSRLPPFLYQHEPQYSPSVCCNVALPSSSNASSPISPPSLKHPQLNVAEEPQAAKRPLFKKGSTKSAQTRPAALPQTPDPKPIQQQQRQQVSASKASVGPLSQPAKSPSTPSGPHAPDAQAQPLSPPRSTDQTQHQPASPSVTPNTDTAFTPGLEGDSRRVLFNRISRSYDELNDRLSFGQHWVWKRMAVKWCGAKRGHRVLDVCCGSGDIGLLLADVVGPHGKVVGLDFANEMLVDAAARQKALEAGRPYSKQHAPIQWVQGDAMALPFKSREFHAATMGYGLRNVASIPAALSELHRVLKPGGKVAILDFNNSQSAMVDRVQAFFLESIVIPAAREYGLEAEYKYLRPSIKQFPTGAEQEVLAKAAGFKEVVHYPIGFWLMGVLVATKGS